MLDFFLDDGMSSAADRESRRRYEAGARPAERLRLRGVHGQHVEHCERLRRPLERRNRRREIAQQRVVQRLLPGERALLCGQGLVLEGLQLRGDVALGVLERLPAPVVVRNALDVRVRDFDVEAVHAVVLDPEAGDARASALARFELDQKRTAVLLDRA